MEVSGAETVGLDRPPRVHQQEQRNLLSLCDQLLGHLECDDASGTLSTKRIGSTRLNAANLRNERCRSLGESSLWRVFPAEALAPIRPKTE